MKTEIIIKSVLLSFVFAATAAVASENIVVGTVKEFNYEDEPSAIIVVDKKGKETQITLAKGGECFLNEFVNKEITFSYKKIAVFNESAGEKITIPVILEMSVTGNTSSGLKWSYIQPHLLDKKDKYVCIDSLINVFAEPLIKPSATPKQTKTTNQEQNNPKSATDLPYEVTISNKAYRYDGEDYRHIRITAVSNTPYTLKHIISETGACKFYIQNVELPVKLNPGEHLDILQRAKCKFWFGVQTGGETRIHNSSNVKVPVLMGN